MCIAASLSLHRTTGKGQLIDLSQYEVLLNGIECVLER